MGSQYPYPDSERFLVLLNPGAGGGPVSLETLRRRLGGAFAARGVPFDIVEAAGAEEGLRVTRAAATRGYRAIVAVGGDGTVSVALRGVAGTRVPVAIIPFGTGNQLALNFDIPTSLEDSVRVAVEGEVTEIDLARANGEMFALMAGAGLDAQVMAGATAELKSRLGFAAYLYSGLKNVIGHPDADFRITADKEELHVKAQMVLLANAGQLGAGPLPVEFRMAPGVSFQDGLIDVCIYAPRNLPEVARILWRVTRNRFAGDDQMVFFQARRVRIEADPPVAIQIDGEPRGVTPIEAEVAPLAACILVPR
ncbi:diacylglycerol/lipid kinase family protein [Candidatus Palauibacter sp.]|uniref:diacylglycerol/lipid kinase family protein n=1 Tax=Candidatus Palauibacter sp. TaxID=3101350 RepID=UPI003AF22912